MVSLPLRDAPAGGLRGWLHARLDSCRDFAAMIGAASRVANAVESHRRPHADDLRVLGVREFPDHW